MNKKKLTTTLASLALVGALGIGATLAYLSDQSDPITNTFTVGNGYEPTTDDPKSAIWIDEAKIGDDRPGEKKYTDEEGEDRTLTGNDYINIQAGSTITKDPTVRLTQKSVKSHIIVKVTGIVDQSNPDPVYTVNLPADFSENWKYIADENAAEGTATASIQNGYYLYVGKNNIDEQYIFNNGTGGENDIVSKVFFNRIQFSTNLTTQMSKPDDIKLSVCALQAVKSDDNEQRFIADKNKDGSLTEDEVKEYVLNYLPVEFTNQ